RDRDAPNALPRKPGVRRVAVKLDGCALLDDDGQCAGEPALEQRTHERPEIRLAANRPVKADAARTGEDVERAGTCGDRVARTLPRRERQRASLVDQPSALGFSPASDVFPVTHPRIRSHACGAFDLRMP